MPVCAYDKKMKKSCKNDKIFCVGVLKNGEIYAIIYENKYSITSIGRARVRCMKKGG